MQSVVFVALDSEFLFLPLFGEFLFERTLLLVHIKPDHRSSKGTYRGTNNFTVLVVKLVANHRTGNGADGSAGFCIPIGIARGASGEQRGGDQKCCNSLDAGVFPTLLATPLRSRYETLHRSTTVAARPVCSKWD